MKVLVNRCYGGFGYSFAAFKEYYGDPINKYVQLRSEDYKADFVLKNEHSPSSVFETILRTDLPVVSYKDCDKYFCFHEDIARDDPKMVAIVERLGSELASHSLADIRIVEIPDGIEYEISDYDGMESVHEAHRSWS